MNRPYFVLLSLLLTSGAALGRDTDRPSVYESDETGEMAAKAFETVLRHGAFVSFDVEYSQVLRADAWFVGIKGGWIANHRFIVGLAGSTMANGISPPRGAPTAATNVRFVHGGLWLEYVLLHDKPVHASLGTLLGGGKVTYTVPRPYPSTPGHEPEMPNTTVAIFEPSANLEVSLSRSVRLSAGVGYRLVGNTLLEGLSNDDLSSLTGAVRIKLGVF
jgi:hypothetical protein